MDSLDSAFFALVYSFLNSSLLFKTIVVIYLILINSKLKQLLKK